MPEDGAIGPITGIILPRFAISYRNVIKLSFFVTSKTFNNLENILLCLGVPA